MHSKSLFNQPLINVLFYLRNVEMDDEVRDLFTAYEAFKDAF